jgi:hypothetical protein
MERTRVQRQITKLRMLQRIMNVSPQDDLLIKRSFHGCQLELITFGIIGVTFISLFYDRVKWWKLAKARSELSFARSSSKLRRRDEKCKRSDGVIIFGRWQQIMLTINEFRQPRGLSTFTLPRMEAFWETLVHRLSSLPNYHSKQHFARVRVGEGGADLNRRSKKLVGQKYRAETRWKNEWFGIDGVWV